MTGFQPVSRPVELPLFKTVNKIAEEGKKRIFGKKKGRFTEGKRPGSAFGVAIHVKLILVLTRVSGNKSGLRLTVFLAYLSVCWTQLEGVAITRPQYK